MTTAHAALLLLALTGAALAGPAQPRRPLEHAGEVLLQDFVPQEPAELSPINTPVDRQSGGGFSPEFPTIQAGQPLPEAPRNEAGFFEMPPNFPNMETLRGFSSTFDGSQSAVNNIDVPGIQFPQSPFQTSRQDDQEPLFQNSPGLS